MFGCFLFVVVFVVLCFFVSEPVTEPAVEAVPDVQLPTLEELMAEAEALIAKPLPPRAAALVAQAAAVSAPVAVSVVKVEAPAWAAMTAVELRKECQRRGVAWRNAHGAGKHLRKGEMVRALM